MEPPIFISGISYDEFLGFARAFGERYGDTKAAFIIFPTWSIETPEKARAIRSAFLRHAYKYPNHHLRYICNTPGEAAVLREAGQPAIFLNNKFTVSERIFRPLADIKVEYDAIYNARFVPEKRHDLASQIEAVAYLAYVEPQETRKREFREMWPRIAARCPRHVLLNRLEDGLPVAADHSEVNIALSRAATGLILSEVEGASYAAMEYMLAGLPVVSTRSTGGREVYFDPEYCIVCEPDARAVRDAVAALRARNIPRSYIRERTLRKIEPPRQQFLALLDEFLDELGAPARFGTQWPFDEQSGVPWKGFGRHLEDFERVSKTTLERELGVADGSLDEVQLSAVELRPVIQEIRAFPQCSLLVFGCGHDSPMWESVNAAGHTAFIEHDTEWASVARGRLKSAPVHCVTYDTRLRDWRSMLDRPDLLSLALPAEVESRRWDVIIVDGPPGYADDLPGRMKSIYAASRLVATGGRVFVHDCERSAEDAFASRYLGADRLFLEVAGRALLRGYAF